MDLPIPWIETADLSVGYELVATVPELDGGAAQLMEVEPVPGTALLAALDTRGVIWTIDAAAARAEPMIDLRDAEVGFMDEGREAGLRSMAFHPNFAREGMPGYGKVYIGYAASLESAPGDVRVFDLPADVAYHEVIAEFTVGDPFDPVVDVASKRELYRLEDYLPNHNLGDFVFNGEVEIGDADYGMLYITHGDGGGSYDEYDLAQDPSHPFGTMFRIDPLGHEGGAAYRAPDDNPEIPGALDEVYAYGFRNGQHFEFTDGMIWLGDVGQESREEINIVVPGGNYGWDLREGTRAVMGNTTTDLPAGGDPEVFQYPIVELDRDLRTNIGFAVTGGYVYEGDGVPVLEGYYVFAIFPDGRVFVIPSGDVDDLLSDGRIDPDEGHDASRLHLEERNGLPTSFTDQVGSAFGRADLRFGEDADGEILFFGKHRGEILRIVEAGTGAGRGALDREDVKTLVMMFEGILDRDGEIEVDEISEWVTQREKGLSERQVAEALLLSEEFKEKFGEVPDDRADQVALFYRNLRNREGDEEGMAWWAGKAEDLDLSPSELFLAIQEGHRGHEALGHVDSLVEKVMGVSADREAEN